jgi:uncharacterized protein YceK
MNAKWRTLLSLVLVVVLVSGCSTIIDSVAQVAAVTASEKTDDGRSAVQSGTGI